MTNTRPDRRFAYRGVKPDGVRVHDVIVAEDDRTAYAALHRQNILVTELVEDQGRAEGAAGQNKPITATDRVLALRQLSVLTRAGVPILEALDTIASGLRQRGIGAQIENVARALRQGAPVHEAFSTQSPGFPPYVYAIIAAGEATGRLPTVLEAAASQVALEDRARRDLLSALAYPAFLLAAAGLVLTFLFVSVVPAFKTMAGQGASAETGLPALVFGFSDLLIAHGLWIGAAMIATFAWAVSALRSAPTQARIGELGLRLPLLGPALYAQRRARWARILSFGLGAGIGLVDATDLANKAVPEGAFRNRMTEAIVALRAGKPVEQAFAGGDVLDDLDVSLLRAGQRSGALAEMFGLIAERHETSMRDKLKQVSVVVEQGAIAVVALAIGTVVISLVSTLVSVYDAIQ